AYRYSMNECVNSDTTSDSDFDEQDLLIAEEDDDSIAPDEDVADEDEINDLVKESQMSLTDLLASYGVSAPVPTNPFSESSGSSVTTSVARSGRLRARRQAVRRLLSPEEIGGTASNTGVQSKRNRLSVPSPATYLPHSEAPQSNSSAPSSPRKRNLSHSDDCTRSGELLSVINEKSPPSLEAAAHLPSLEFNSRAPSMPPCEFSTSPNSRPRRRTASLCVTTDKNPVDKSDPTPEPPTPRNPPVVQLSTVCPPELGQQGIISSDASSAASPLLSNHVAGTLKDEGGENKDSDHDDGFPSRFWQRAIGAGESPPSYNSDEDEDYAPSLDSGLDWRGEIRVGDEYQAHVPSSILSNPPTNISDWWDTKRIENDSCRLWQPGKLLEEEVVHFERLFAQTVMFPLPNERTMDDEEALFLLMRCNYDLDEALQRLRFRTVSPTEIPGYMEAWSEADSTAFEKGFALYNKDFRQIRETRLRHKTVGELVHYYYLWKKTVRHDRFARTYRRDKRKSPHPSITDFMDYLVLEQEAVAESYPYNTNSSVRTGAASPCSNHKLTSRNPPGTYSELTQSVAFTQPEVNLRINHVVSEGRPKAVFESSNKSVNIPSKRELQFYS
ncbi:uncharacterized protein DEA37_0011510, partial [Paragonimus westermani]